MRRAPGGVPLRQLAFIVFAVGMLVALLVLKRRCAESVGNVFRVLDAEAHGDGGARPPSVGDGAVAAPAPADGGRETP